MDHHSTAMRVTTVDRDGNQIGPAELVSIPNPDHIAANGFDHIREYIDRLIACEKRCSSLGIFDRNDRGFGVFKIGATIEICPIVTRSHSSSEPRIRQFFETRSLAPTRDYTADRGATRVLQYPLKADGLYITQLCQDLLREVYDISPTGALDFTYQERE